MTDAIGRIQALLGIVYSGDWLAFIKEACADPLLFFTSFDKLI